ncbi:MAG: aldo/keto reductase [Clostridia bacterium]|nr:aldo/keto reductase [Clostridia bacterium]
MEYFELNDGNKMPVIGIGTFMLTPAQAEESTFNALKAGYRLIDTANAYVNEKAVGRGMKKSGVAREDIFLTTKLWPTVYENENAIDKTLERLDTDYIDLLLLHQPAGNYINAYKMMEKAVKEGKVKSIGLSNFDTNQIQEIIDMCEIKPAILQVEAHPYYTEEELKAFVKPYGVRLMAWYPLGHGDASLINEEVFAKLGEKYGKSPVQIILRWHVQMGHVVIPGATLEEHIKANIEILDFELTSEDMAEIAKVNKNKRYYEPNPEIIASYAQMAPDMDGQE